MDERVFDSFSLKLLFYSWLRQSESNKANLSLLVERKEPELRVRSKTYTLTVSNPTENCKKTIPK